MMFNHQINKLSYKNQIKRLNKINWRNKFIIYREIYSQNKDITLKRYKIGYKNHKN